MRVALVNPDAFTVWQFRRGLIKALLKRSISVHVISADDAYVERVKSLGVTYHPIRFGRFINVKLDTVYLLSLCKIFRSQRFDIVHNFTVKPNIYGAIAAKLAGVPRIIETVEGLGFTFSSSSGSKDKLLKQFIKLLYRISFGLSDRVWFLNQDDMNLMVSSGIVGQEKSVLIRSTGVNVTEYSTSAIDLHELENLKSELQVKLGTLLVSMIVSRLVWSKGVAEFVKAAEMLLSDFPHVKFILVGPVDDSSPDSIPAAFLQSGLPRNVWWSDFREDVQEVLALSDVVVSPSYYGEGVPRVLLEAMAMSKPIVTTDNVGCREVVNEGQNGYLVPVRDAHALAKAISDLLRDEKKRQRFGHHSRVKVEAEFDERSVVDKALKLLYGLD